MATFEQTNLTAFQNRINSNTLTAADQALLVQSLNFVILNWGETGISVDPNTNVGTDPSPVDAEWFAPLYAEALGAVTGGTLVPTSWTQPAWFRTGSVSVIRSAWNFSTQFATTRRDFSCKAFVPGNREAVCPSEPIPSNIRSNRGHSPALRRNAFFSVCW